MDAETYGKIRAFVTRNLIGPLLGEADDATQYIALEYALNPAANWKFLLVDWLRANGHGERGKAGGKALFRAVRVGVGNDEETGAAEALLDTGRTEEFFAPEEAEAGAKIIDGVKEFLIDLGYEEGKSQCLANQFLESEKTKNQSRSQKKEDGLFNA